VQTERLPVDPRHPDETAIARAAECLRGGGLVAFPTETVYGLGVHALDASAVRRLFDAKGRPATDPLIVHVPDVQALAALVEIVPATAMALAGRFWPGPLTLVLRRSRLVPDEVTAGLDTVAIRVPAHPVARALLEAAAIPIAAPSANLFSRPSPTRASHVLEDLDGRIDLVIDGGATTVGVESTVLDLSRQPPTILRPGAVTLEMLRPLVSDVRLAEPSPSGGAMPSPGLLEKHYSPRAPLTLYAGANAIDALLRDADEAQAHGSRVGVLVGAGDVDAARQRAWVVCEIGPDAEAIARGLYAALRELDTAGVDVILARAFPIEGGLGVAIHDRLRRAAAGRIVG
jgi:L-threonylcarbamoyladenylate synthase